MSTGDRLVWNDGYFPSTTPPLPLCAGTGWTCANCGMFVPSGILHACPIPIIDTGPVWGPTDLQKVIELLERIAKALEKAK
jgi:hypothetical protein